MKPTLPTGTTKLTRYILLLVPTKFLLVSSSSSTGHTLPTMIALAVSALCSPFPSFHAQSKIAITNGGPWHDPQVPAYQGSRPQCLILLGSAGGWWFYHQSFGTQWFRGFPMLQVLHLSCKW